MSRDHRDGQTQTHLRLAGPIVTAWAVSGDADEGAGYTRRHFGVGVPVAVVRGGPVSAASIRQSAKRGKLEVVEVDGRTLYRIGDVLAPHGTVDPDAEHIDAA